MNESKRDQSLRILSGGLLLVVVGLVAFRGPLGFEDRVQTLLEQVTAGAGIMLMVASLRQTRWKLLAAWGAVLILAALYSYFTSSPQ